MLMIIAFNCGIIDTNKPFMIQIFGTQRYMLKKKPWEMGPPASLGIYIAATKNNARALYSMCHYL